MNTSAGECHEGNDIIVDFDALEDEKIKLTDIVSVSEYARPWVARRCF